MLEFTTIIIACRYGEKKCRPEELLAKFATFMVDFKKSLHEIDKVSCVGDELVEIKMTH